MSMQRARLVIAILGLLATYVARLPLAMTHGVDWLTSYFSGGIAGLLFVAVFSTACWGTILLFSILCEHPLSLLPGAMLGFGRLMYLHHDFDLAADAQAALCFIWFPIWAAGYAAAGGAVGLVLDALLHRKAMNGI